MRLPWSGVPLLLALVALDVPPSACSDEHQPCSLSTGSWTLDSWSMQALQLEPVDAWASMLVEATSPEFRLRHGRAATLYPLDRYLCDGGNEGREECLWSETHPGILDSSFGDPRFHGTSAEVFVVNTPRLPYPLAQRLFACLLSRAEYALAAMAAVSVSLTHRLGDDLEMYQSLLKALLSAEYAGGAAARATQPVLVLDAAQVVLVALQMAFLLPATGEAKNCSVRHFWERGADCATPFSSAHSEHGPFYEGLFKHLDERVSADWPALLRRCAQPMIGLVACLLLPLLAYHFCWFQRALFCFLRVVVRTGRWGGAVLFCIWFSRDLESCGPHSLCYLDCRASGLP